MYEQIKYQLTRLKCTPKAFRQLDFLRTEDNSHGRHEVRKYWVSGMIECIRSREEWPDLKSFGCVESTRTINGKASTEIRYFISSHNAYAYVFAKHIRGHWKIENSCHWVLDVCFDADHNRARTGHAAENFAILQSLALNLLKQEYSVKTSNKIKRQMCACSDTYLQNVFSRMLNKF